MYMSMYMTILCYAIIGQLYIDIEISIALVYTLICPTSVGHIIPDKLGIMCDAMLYLYGQYYGITYNNSDLCHTDQLPCFKIIDVRCILPLSQATDVYIGSQGYKPTFVSFPTHSLINISNLHYFICQLSLSHDNVAMIAILYRKLLTVWPLLITVASLT
jgi:hypothetical protein